MESGWSKRQSFHLSALGRKSQFLFKEKDGRTKPGIGKFRPDPGLTLCSTHKLFYLHLARGTAEGVMRTVWSADGSKTKAVWRMALCVVMAIVITISVASIAQA
jgi:hypothetical protein